MLPQTNKNKTQLFSFVSPKNINQNNNSFIKNITNPQSLLLSSNLSFTDKTKIKNTQTLNSQKHQINKLQKNISYISKNISNPSIRNIWQSDPRDYLPEQSDKKFLQKENNRLKTTQTVESEVFGEENTEKQQEYHKIKISQPCEYSMRESSAHIKQKYSLKQSSKREPFKFIQSTACLNPTLQSSASYISPKNLQSDRAFADSRLKLRDYLYMMNTSANLAAGKKHSLKNSLNICSDDNSRNKNFSRTNQSKITNNMQKYKITNQQMCQVLKKQIKLDINNLRNKLNCIGKWVNGLQNVENDQIKHLYQLRREIQLYGRQIQEYCVNKIKIACPSARQSIVNIIHQNEQQDFFVEI